MSATYERMRLTTVDHMTRTPDEAIKIMRAARTNAHFRIHVAIDAPLLDDPEHYIPGGFRAGVEVSRGVAEKFVMDAFSERLQARGAGLKISVYTGERRTRWNPELLEMVAYGSPRVTVWIG